MRYNSVAPLSISAAIFRQQPKVYLVLYPGVIPELLGRCYVVGRIECERAYQLLEPHISRETYDSFE